MKTIATRTAVRFIADAASLACGMVSGVITARYLGPQGKGVLSSLQFLGALASQMSCLGLQESLIVLIGQKRATRQDAFSASLAAVLASTAAGLVGFLAACAVQFGLEPNVPWLAVAVACLGVVVSNFSNILSGVLVAQDRIIVTSVAMLVTSGGAALATWVFVVLVPLSTLGGVLGSLAGTTTGLVLTAGVVRSVGLSFRPRWEYDYLAAALRLGVVIQLSYVFASMVNRVDLLLVYSLAGRSEAGLYSVALTLGSLVMLIPYALSLVTFPVLARVDEAEAAALISRTCRYAVLASLGFGVVLSLICPVLVPLVFGAVYRPAVLPAVVLIVGDVPLGLQWLLARAAAARGRPEIILYSYAASLLAMVALDFVLIPTSGLLGAAVASAVAPALGLAVCLYCYRRHSSVPVRLARLIPQPHDVYELFTLTRKLVYRG